MASADIAPNLDTIVADLWHSLFQQAGDALWRGAVKTGKVAALLGVLAVTFPTTGSALGTAEERSACIPDAFRLCSAEIPHAGRVIACLKLEKAKLSEACRSVMKRNGTI